MEHLIEGVRDAVRKECWYPALALALSIPDTCGSIDDPGQGKSKRRYVAWFNTYTAQDFRSAAPHSQQFFSGEDLYAVRCAFLHEGDFEFKPGEPKFNGRVVDGVRLMVSDDHEIMPSLGWADDGNAQYTVAVKDLCESICKGAEAWLLRARQDQQKVAALTGLKRITRFHNYKWTPI